MTATVLEWDDDAGVAYAIEFDAAPSQGYESAAEVTEHPVENGVAIADHVRPLNSTFSLEAIITNAPVRVPTTQMHGVTRSLQGIVLPGGDGAQQASVQTWSGEFDRVGTCDALLNGLVKAAQVVRITTGLRVEENLAITRYKVDRNAETGQALPVVLEFKQMRIVSTSRAPVPAVRRAQFAAPRGAVPVDNRTAAARIGDSAVASARAYLASHGGGL